MTQGPRKLLAWALLVAFLASCAQGTPGPSSLETAPAPPPRAREGDEGRSFLATGKVERMHLRLLTLPDREAAVIAQAEIERGLPFHIAVRDRSIGPNALRGGYVGEVRLASLLPQVRATVAHLREGEMSAIVKTPEGYSIFMRTTDRHFRAAMERIRKGRYAEALPFLEKELKLNRDNIRAWLALGVVHSAFGRLAEAEAAYRRALEFDPEEASIYNNLGNVYVRLGRYDLAIEMYEKALQREPDLALVLSNLAYLLAATGRDLRAAEGYIEEAIRLEPEEASHYDVRAQVHMRAGRMAEARRDLEKAIQLDPQNLEYRKRLLAWGSGREPTPLGPPSRLLRAIDPLSPDPGKGGLPTP